MRVRSLSGMSAVAVPSAASTWALLSHAPPSSRVRQNISKDPAITITAVNVHARPSPGFATSQITVRASVTANTTISRRG